jgi:hypothetical protein
MSQKFPLHSLKDQKFCNRFATLGDIAQLARAPQWHCGGRGFDSHCLHGSFDDLVISRLGDWSAQVIKNKTSNSL